MLQFDWPYLFLLLPLPILALLFLPRIKNSSTALMVPFYKELAAVHEHELQHKVPNLFSFLILILIWILSLTAAARPQWIGDPISLPVNARDLLIAVDISSSMETPDMILDNYQVDRLTVVKKVVGEFVRRRENDRLGLILFGDQAYLQSPLTFDRETVNTFLQEARLGFAGPRTAIGDAIGLATKRLLDRPEQSRILILLTDGANTSGRIDPLMAATLAHQAKVKIYTIGIGADEYTTPGILGGRLGRRRINASTDLDEETLQAIADQTGGAYFRARDVNDLEQIYTQLDILEPLEQDPENYRPTTALFYWPLALALGFSMFLALTGILRSGNSPEYSH